MVDLSKRKTIMSVGGMMALPILPALASADTSPLNEKDNHDSIPVAEQNNAVHNKSELNIELLPDGTSPVARVTNTSDTLIILRKINLGIVQAGGKTYDLNRSLLSGAYAISAGRSRLIPLIEAGSTPAESELSARYGHRTMRVATLESSKGNMRMNNTVSAMFV